MNETEMEKVRNAIKRVIELRRVLENAKREARDAAVHEENCGLELEEAKLDAGRCVHAVFGKAEPHLCYRGRLFVFHNQASPSIPCKLLNDYEITVLTD